MTKRTRDLDRLQKASVGMAVLRPVIVRPDAHSQHALGVSVQLVMETVQQGGSCPLLGKHARTHTHTHIQIHRHTLKTTVYSSHTRDIFFSSW